MTGTETQMTEFLPVILPLVWAAILAADVVGARLLGFEAQGVHHLWEAARLGVGESDSENMDFPAMSLKAAIEAFTLAAYGERLTFEHA